MRITDTMYSFLSGESELLKSDASAQLASQWNLFDPGSLAPTFALLWSARHSDWTGTPEQLMSELIGPHGTLDHCRLERWQVTNGPAGVMARSFRAAVLVECDFARMDLRGSRFDGAWVESVNFSSSDLRNVDFTGASLLDVDVTDAQFAGADMRGAEAGLYIKDSGRELTANAAMGLLKYRGAHTPAVPDIFVAMAHPGYEIARKIARKISEGGQSQLLGLTQRGASQKDPTAAQKFVTLLASVGFASYDRSGSARTVEATIEGRLPLRQLAEETNLDPAFRSYFGITKLVNGTGTNV